MTRIVQQVPVYLTYCPACKTLLKKEHQFRKEYGPEFVICGHCGNKVRTQYKQWHLQRSKEKISFLFGLIGGAVLVISFPWLFYLITRVIPFLRSLGDVFVEETCIAGWLLFCGGGMLYIVGIQVMGIVESIEYSGAQSPPVWCEDEKDRTIH